MKYRKLLDKLNKLTGLGNDADREEIEKLRVVLKALKEKQNKFAAKLEQAEGEHERRKLKQKLEVIQQQRKKGLDVYKRLREIRDA